MKKTLPPPFHEWQSNVSYLWKNEAVFKRHPDKIAANNVAE